MYKYYYKKPNLAILFQYSLEGHQFAVFSICLTSDYRYVVSISNRFITWDLSTSDLTRDVNPNIEGIMQHLVLSPDNKWAAAYTNNHQVSIKYILLYIYIHISKDATWDCGENVTFVNKKNTQWIEIRKFYTLFHSYVYIYIYVYIVQ